MRILVANKFWYRRGGLEQVMFDEIEALESAGHEVAHFSTTHPRNDPSPYSDYFVRYIELGGDAPLSLADKGRATVRLFANREAARGFAQLIRDFKPDVVHVHGIHRQISPSILSTAHAMGVPVVHTLHDMHLVCPEDRLLRAGCEACMPPLCRRGRYWPAIANRCAHGSDSVSALAATELAFQRARGVYERCVTRFTSPSDFLAARMHDDGLASVPIDIIRNPVRPSDSPAPHGDYFLYAGRLAEGKGVEVLLAAADSIGAHVVVAGEGPLGEGLRESFQNAEFVGWRDAAGVGELLRGCRAAVLPSTCVENAPLGVLEAMAAGVPVIATTVGGVPELLTDGVEGLLVPPGDAASLASAMGRLAGDERFADELGAAGMARAVAEFGMARHLELLLVSYGDAMETAARTH